MDSIKDYSFASLELNHLTDLIYLYKKVFGILYSKEQMKAKYFNEYTGIRAQGYFAFHQGKAVAFHGAIPVYVSQGGKIELSAQFGDAMTLKKHTGKGLFTKLGELTELKLKGLGVKFVWGFPNQNSEYAYVHKLNWMGQQRMNCYTIPLKKISSEPLFRKSGILYQHYLKHVKSTLKSIIQEKRSFSSIDTMHHGGIDRSTDFYNYKSFTPNYFINLNGTTVWVKPQGGLLIGDIELSGTHAMEEIVRDLKLLAKKLKLNKIVLQASPKSSLNLRMKKLYNPINSWLIGYKNFNSSFHLEDLQFTYGDLDTF